MMKYLIISIIVIAFMSVDFLTGIIKAFKSKAFTSTTMREGLYHKFSSILICVASILIDVAQAFIELGFSVPVFVGIASYICLMEIGSIVENVCTINPNILPDKIKALFEKLKGGGANG